MKFFQTLLATILGTLIALFLIFLILLGIIASSSGEPEPHIRQNTVLTLNMMGDIPSRTPFDPIQELLQPDTGDKISLYSLKTNLRKAANDDRIAGIWVKTNFLATSWANLEIAYSYFEEYKESGKFLYFSTDDIGYNEQAYFLATLADSVFSPSETMFEFDGFISQTNYYKNMLEKIGVEPQIIRAGKYKSAVEPYLRESASPESKEQTARLISGATNTFINAVERKTGLTESEINQLMNTMYTRDVNQAYENGLIDMLAYPSEVENIIRERLELSESARMNTVSFGRYTRVTERSAGVQSSTSTNRIAVIYADGIIMPDLGASGIFGSDTGISVKGIKKQLDEIKDDRNVKAIILHVNSPGGSASTSDIIWHMVREAAEDRPVIASMGSVAASGGYYIAMAADTIVASPNTITGSIGVFNLMFSAQEMLNDRLGITLDGVKSHDHADVLSMTRPFTPSERRAFEASVQKSYESFLSRVGESRGMNRDDVHLVAQGRVWTGTDALEAGLVDVIGGLDTAIEIASQMAEIEDYSVVNYPKPKSLNEALFGSASTTVRSMIQSVIPYKNELESLDAIMRHPAGQNWMLLPVEFMIQ
jgi:protease-4